MAYDPIAALATLQRYGVEFVVIGGVAARLWGSPTMTNDVDICYSRDRGNLQRLAAALEDLDARLRDVDDDVPFRLDSTTLANGQNFTFTTRSRSSRHTRDASRSPGFWRTRCQRSQLRLRKWSDREGL